MEAIATVERARSGNPTKAILAPYEEIYRFLAIRRGLPLIAFSLDGQWHLLKQLFRLHWGSLCLPLDGGLVGDESRHRIIPSTVEPVAQDSKAVQQAHGLDLLITVA